MLHFYEGMKRVSFSSSTMNAGVQQMFSSLLMRRAGQKWGRGAMAKSQQTSPPLLDQAWSGPSMWSLFNWEICSSAKACFTFVAGYLGFCECDEELWTLVEYAHKDQDVSSRFDRIGGSRCSTDPKSPWNWHRLASSLVPALQMLGPQRACEARDQELSLLQYNLGYNANIRGFN